MKKIILFSLGLFLSVVVFGQQIAKKYVVVETCTEDGCPYCPDAQAGLEYLVDNGYNIVPIGYHYGNYGNSDGNSRMSFYGLQYFPTSYFNGHRDDVGGGNTTSRYVSDYNAVVGETSSFDVEIISLSSSNDIDFTAEVKIKKVADYSGTNLKLIALVTENRVDYSWEGVDHLSYIQRTMLPNYNGTAISLNTGDSTIIEFDFSIETDWEVDSLNFIAFVQDMGSKEILQVDKHTMSLPAGTNNVILQQIESPTDNESVCETGIYPTIMFKNKGSAELTECDFVTEINGEYLDTLHWTGNLASQFSMELTLDFVEYTQLDNNELRIFAMNPNGIADDYPENDTAVVNFVKSDETTTIVYLDMNTGNWGFEISYALFDTEGNKVDSSGTLFGNQAVLDTFNLELDKCYYFELYDSYGNGFNSEDGYCKLMNYRGVELVNFSGNFGDEVDYNFRTTTPAEIFTQNNAEISIYPNPVDNTLFVKFDNTGDYQVKLFNSKGQIVANKVVKNTQNTWVDVSALPQGIYFLTIEGVSLNSSRKIIIH